MIRSRTGLFGWLLVLLGAPAWGGAPPPAIHPPLDVVFNTPAQFAGCFREGTIDVTTAPGEVRLVPTDTVNTWNGYRVGRDTLTTARWARVTFALDQPLSSGRALFFIFGQMDRALVNGTALDFKPWERTGWSRAEIDAAVLRSGVNELRFTSKGSLAYDREIQPPVNSQISHDGGQSWQAAPGEYLVRIRLPRHPIAGTLTSDSIDLANPRQENRLCPALDIQSVRGDLEAVTPRGTQIDLRLRTGPTPRPDEQWSDWRAPNAALPARFVQWRATLRTTRPNATPVLKSVRISASALTSSMPAQTLKLIEFRNETIVRGSYPFTYQTPSPKLARLRSEWRLDDIVAPGQTELEKFILLRNWVRRQWPANEGNCQRPWDALNILAAPAGDHGMCVHYAVVFAQCAQALGYNARQIILANHYVADIWSEDYRKWILMDVETVHGEAPSHWGTALYWDSQTDEPLSALDIHRTVFQERAPGRIVQKLVLQTPESVKETVDRRYGEEDYYNFLRIGSLPRNNYLDQLEPWEVAHGFDYYHCDEYLWWRDTATPIVSEFTRHTDRAGDVDWTVNQAALILTATEHPDRLAVLADTVTPNFKAFRYRLNGSDWRDLSGTGTDPHSRQAAFDWPLTAGTNTLEIKTRNRFDREGRLSRVVLVSTPAE